MSPCVGVAQDVEADLLGAVVLDEDALDAVEGADVESFAPGLSFAPDFVPPPSDVPPDADSLDDEALDDEPPDDEPPASDLRESLR